MSRIYEAFPNATLSKLLAQKLSELVEARGRINAHIKALEETHRFVSGKNGTALRGLESPPEKLESNTLTLHRTRKRTRKVGRRGPTGLWVLQQIRARGLTRDAIRWRATGVESRPKFFDGLTRHDIAKRLANAYSNLLRHKHATLNPQNGELRITADGIAAMAKWRFGNADDMRVTAADLPRK